MLQNSANLKAHLKYSFASPPVLKTKGGMHLQNKENTKEPVSAENQKQKTKHKKKGKIAEVYAKRRQRQRNLRKNEIKRGNCQKLYLAGKKPSKIQKTAG